MDKFEAIFVIFLLTWAAVSVSGTTPELSKTTGDTVNIPCVFGEGTLRNIYWYYNDGTGPQKILFLSNGVLAIDQDYADRAGLQNDNLTLILKDITVYDEGTYRCDVDRQGQTPVPNINTKLNVFSLRPDTLPVISPCTVADDSSSCSIHVNQSFTLTCTLPNVYPVEDTELIWYQDERRVSFPDDVTQNDDGTTNISRQIQVSETGNFTCNATYLSVNGKENTAASVKAWIIPPADVPNTPGKKMTTGQIVGMTIGIVLLVGLATIIFLIVYPKARAHCTFSNNTNSNAKHDQAESQSFIKLSTGKDSKNVKGAESISIPAQQTIHLSPQKAGDGDPPKLQNRKDDSQLVQVTEDSKLLGTSAEEVSKDEKVDGDDRTSQKINDNSQQNQVTETPKLLGSSAEKVPKDEKVDGDDQTSEKINDRSQQDPVTETPKLLGSSAEKVPKDEKVDGENRTSQTINDDSQRIPAEDRDRLTPHPNDGGSQQHQEPSKPFKRPTEKLSKDEEEKTSPTEETDFDDIILAIAEKIPYDDINKLGKKLGFNSTAIEKYVATNSRHQNITSQGTLEMLRAWNKKKTKKTEQATLKKALIDAGLVHLADEVFPEIGSDKI